MQESSHHSLKIVFPDGVGQYFATVIAYNYAMSPSKPICSDGVTLDKSIPNVNNVGIKNGKTVQSIGCHDNKPWLIKEDTSKIKLIGDTCFHICENEPNDEILSVLLEKMKNKSENADVSLSKKYSICRTIGLSDYRTIGLSHCRTIGPSDYRTVGLSDYRSDPGISDPLQMYSGRLDEHD